MTDVQGKPLKRESREERAMDILAGVLFIILGAISLFLLVATAIFVPSNGTCVLVPACFFLPMGVSIIRGKKKKKHTRRF